MANPYAVGTFLFQWWNWGGFAALAVAFVATFWLFFDAQRAGNDATLWKTLAVIGAVFVIPFVLARVNLSFALSVKDSLAMLAFLNIGGMGLVLVSAIGHAATRQPYRCPRCGSPMNPSWSVCPSCPPPAPVIAPGPTLHFEQPENGSGRAAPATQVGIGSTAPSVSNPTMILGSRAPKAKEAPSFAWLIALTGPRTGEHYPISSGVTEVGRDGTRDIILDDESISEKHFVVRLEQGEFRLQDAASSNGTFLNGEAVAGKVDLHDWDVVRAGETELVFMRVNREANSRPTASASPTTQETPVA